jgi:ribosomal protein L37E
MMNVSEHVIVRVEMTAGNEWWFCKTCERWFPTYLKASTHSNPSITCPRCGMTSYNPNDVREGYCGNCHDWTAVRRRDDLPEPELPGASAP